MLLTTLFYCFVTRRWSSKSVSSTLGQSRPAKVCMCKYIKEIMANDSANAHDAAQSICSSFSTPSRFPNTKRPSLHGTAPRPLEIFIHEHFNFKLIRSSLVVYLRDSTLLGRFTAIIMASTRTIRWKFTYLKCLDRLRQIRITPETHPENTFLKNDELKLWCGLMAD